MSCCGDLRGFSIVHQPGEMRAALAAAGSSGPVHLVYQPLGGDLVEHWEHFAWLCLARQQIIIMADEVDGICQPGQPSRPSAIFKAYTRPPALQQIIEYGRHSKVAFIGIARAPQSVWIRLRSQAGRMLVFRMSERRELAALEDRLGNVTHDLPLLPQYHYLDWTEGGEVEVRGETLR